MHPMRPRETDHEPVAAEGAVAWSVQLGGTVRTIKEEVMLLNEGRIDRAVRVLLGLALVAMAFIGPRAWLGWLGVILVITGLVGFCPLYRLVGIRTTKTA
jgi:hypothetical protein